MKSDIKKIMYIYINKGPSGAVVSLAVQTLGECTTFL